MATAQQLFVDQFITLINTNPNLNAKVIASSPHPGIMRVTSKGTDTPWITWISAASTVTGTGTFTAKAATGSPQYAEMWFSWTLAPGDTVKLNVGAGTSVDLTYNLPVATTVDAGGFDHTGYTPGGSSGGVAVGGSGIGSAQHRRLVVMECGAASTSFGSLFALDPQDATGVAIPTFKVAQTLPAAGASLGESVYVTATRQGYVWDGTGWRDITSSPILSYANDAALQADLTQQIGVYSVATDTGNMYVMTGDGWRRIGIVEFATYADLAAYDAAIGTEAISRDMDVLFLRVDDTLGNESWIPISELVKTEAQIRATQNVAGLAAIATDTGKRYVNNGTRWIQDPIEHYATEADLLAATPIDGHLAWADDTSVVFTATGGVWNRLQGPQVTYGTTAPTTPGVGDMWFDDSANGQTLNIWTGTAWKGASGVTVGGTGSKVILPGYFNENPSQTATADDIGGLAFRYNGGVKQLWLNKGTNWSAMTPSLGDPANAGKVAIADASGNMTWTSNAGPQSNTFEFNGTQAGWVAIGRPSRYISLEGHVQMASNTSLMLVGQREGSWIDWSSVAQSYANVQYDTGGYRYTDLKSSASWEQSNAGCNISRHEGSYYLQSGKYAKYKVYISLLEDGNMVFEAWLSLLSDNSTPMFSSCMYVITGDFRNHLTQIGIKARSGNMHGTMAAQWV
jgi:hypothetical protein